MSWDIVGLEERMVQLSGGSRFLPAAGDELRPPSAPSLLQAECPQIPQPLPASSWPPLEPLQQVQVLPMLGAPRFVLRVTGMPHPRV